MEADPAPASLPMRPPLGWYLTGCLVRGREALPVAPGFLNHRNCEHAWVAQSVKSPLGFGSGHGRRVVGLSPV